MEITTVVLVVASLACAVLFLNPKLLRSPRWGATVTPLASIIGSGFLVVGPILAATTGTLAWFAMLALCAIGYLFGSAIRHNIAHVEPLLNGNPTKLVLRLERASELVLSFSYFISVAYYLNLFAAFALRLGGVTDPFVVRVVATCVISCIGVLGFLGGLKALERLTLGAVGLKLSLIGGLLITLSVATVIAVHGGTFNWPELNNATGSQELRIVLGLVILVQGFETSRYLGDSYSPEMRIATMRHAQWISTGIYLAFVVLITRYFTNTPLSAGNETGILDMLKPIGSALLPVIVLAALASQLSAAVADTNGAGGLLSELFVKRVSVNVGNVVTASVAIAITWMANIYEIITYASKAFVIYYALQSIQAALAAKRQSKFARAVLYLVGVLIAVVIILWAIPANV